jgi:hypothetical protein
MPKVRPALLLAALLALACGREPGPLPPPPEPDFDCPLPSPEAGDPGALPEPGLSTAPGGDFVDGTCGVGRTGLRRLNRTEYDNTVRDLLRVDVAPARDFPEDDIGEGFDHLADVLSVSPLLAERLEGAAWSVVDAALKKDFEEPRVVVYEAELYPSLSGNPDGAFQRVNGTNPLLIPLHLPATGRYTVRIRVFRESPDGNAVTLGLSFADRELYSFDIEADRESPEVVEVELDLDGGFEQLQLKRASPGRNRRLLVDWVELDGPYGAPVGPDPAARRALLSCTAEELGAEACAREIWSRFAARAWRRPVTDEEMTRLLPLLAVAGEEPPAGHTPVDVFEDGVRLGLVSILLSPHFLYLVEEDPLLDGPDARALTDHELASRLSYFLWRSMPDERLFEIAARGSLQDDAVLEAEVRRMLQDPRSGSLVEDFAGQWLQLRGMDDVWRSDEEFPAWDGELRVNMKCETQLLFSDVLRADGTAMDLLTADYTWATRRLAGHYGLEVPDEPGWHRVSLEGTERGGMLTHGSLLTLTSHPNRTSPVKRGKFVLEQLLCTPPPPPPPGVEGLIEEQASAATVREQLEQHRADPNCASCHELMDPIGFALERFDATGAFRSEDNGQPIDTSGEFFTGTPMNGASDLAAIVAGEPSYSRCLTEKSLIYALGRGLDGADSCALDDVADALAERDYRLSDLFVLIAQSPSFRMRQPAETTLPPAPEDTGDEGGTP